MGGEGLDVSGQMGGAKDGWCGEKENLWSERVSNQLPLDDTDGSLLSELCFLRSWRGAIGYRYEGEVGTTGATEVI